MKREIHRLQVIMIVFLGVLSGMVLSACQGRIRDQHPGAVQVRIPMYSNNAYKLQTIELISIDDMRTLGGWAARFFLSPTLSRGKLVGMQPQINTIRTESGEYIATDSFSLQLLTLYAHMEKLTLLDDELGISRGDESREPRTVAIKVNMMSESGQPDSDNARYNGKLDAFLFAPYLREDLPLTVNAGVIAHEHFHSIFYKTVIQPLGDKYPGPDGNLHGNDQKLLKHFGFEEAASSENVGLLSERDIYHAVLLRGLNEGLADIWGWLYSDDTAFVRRSLPQVEESRTLSSGELKLKSTKELRAQAQAYHSWGNSNAVSYELGSQYGRILFASLNQFAGDPVKMKEMKKKMGQKINSALQKMTIHFQSLPGDEMMTTEFFLQQLQVEIPEVKIEYKAAK
ncbi:MAG: hypothetical protein BroJett040_14250 [Oligoflexia bacterium]|nr:MAG: hypothetical protein BroJett040_14250 [Oligoflexia bacterium]